MRTSYASLAATALTLACLVLPAAHATEPSRASIERLMVVTQAQKMSDAVRQQLGDMLKPMVELALGASEMSPELRQKAQSFMEEFAAKMQPILREELTWERMLDVTVQVYGSSFSQEEIDGMIAFYESPAGRAFVEKMPVVMQKSMALMREHADSLAQKIGRAAEEAAAKFKAAQAATKS